jgi:hypothetical protein
MVGPLKPFGAWTDYQYALAVARRRRRHVTLALVCGFCLVVLNVALVFYLSGQCP